MTLVNIYGGVKLKIKSRVQKHVVEAAVYGEIVELVIDGELSYLPLSAVSRVIDSLTVIEKNEYYSKVIG